MARGDTSMVVALTPRREAFIQAIVAGKSQRSAYRAAFPKSEAWSDRAVDVNACKLFQGTDIQLRYTALIEQSADKALWSFQQSVIELKSLLDLSHDEIDRIRGSRDDEVAWIKAEIENTGDKSKEASLRKKLYETMRMPILTSPIVSALLGSIDRLNKMHGFYTDIFIQNNTTVIFENDLLSDCTDDELRNFIEKRG